MDNKALYLLAHFDEETQNILSGYYKILQQHGFSGKQTKNIPYHFTLGSREVAQKDELLQKMRDICLKTNAIDIGLSHIGLFGLNVLFIAPNMNFEL